MEDIINSYKWTTTQGSYKEETPRVFATAYTIDTNAITDTVKTYYELANETVGVGSLGGIKYYDNLHKYKDPERFVFPFFSDELRSFNNSWGDSYVGSTNGSDTGVDYLEKVKSLAETATNLVNQTNALLSNKPGALFEPPKFYQYSQDENTLTVKFILINTDEAGDASKNYDLVKKLININRFKRDDSNGFIVTPPKLWSVIVPGYRAIRWASCGVSVNMLGSRRYIDKKLVPEGYDVTLSFTPLYTEPSNFSEKYLDTEF